MTPIAPVREVIGLPAPDIVLPPLSVCTTARIHCAGTLKRAEASSIKGLQRFTSSLALILCSCEDVEYATRCCCGAIAGADGVTSTHSLRTQFTTLFATGVAGSGRT